MVLRIGIVGFGHLGQHLVSCIEKSQDYELAFVWNRTPVALHGKINPNLVLDNLTDFASRNPCLIIEVSHPCVTTNYGKLFVSYCDYMIGSPSALCDPEVEKELREAAVSHAIYVPSGALWGAIDIQKMSDMGTLKALKVTMHFHPQSLKLNKSMGSISGTKVFSVTTYEGSVRELCKLAPQNTNTMSAAAIAGHTLGFDKVQGCLISDPNLNDYHIIEVIVQGFPTRNGTCFEVHTVRKNPSKVGTVTGKATYDSFFASLKRAKGKSSGLHIC